MDTENTANKEQARPRRASADGYAAYVADGSIRLQSLAYDQAWGHYVNEAVIPREIAERLRDELTAALAAHNDQAETPPTRDVRKFKTL